MSERKLEDSLRMEMKLKLFPQLQKWIQEKQIDSRLFFLDSPIPGGETLWSPICAHKILSKPRPDTRGANSWIVGGLIGAGKTSLAQYILYCWLKRDANFEGLNKYKACLLINGEEIERNDVWTAVLKRFPDSAAHWGTIALAEWFETMPTLLIIDDFLMDSGEEDNLKDTLSEWKNVHPLLLTSLSDITKAATFFNSVRPVSIQRFRRLGAEEHLAAGDFFFRNYNYGENNKNLKKFLSDLEESAPELLNCLAGVSEAFDMFHKGLENNIPFTTANLIWENLYSKLLQQQTSYNLKTEPLHKWVLILSKRSYDCLMGDAPLLGEETDPLITETKILFREMKNPSFLTETILKKQLTLYSFTRASYSICHSVQQEVLASFYVLLKVMEGTRMSTIIKKMKNEDSVALYVGTLFTKLLTEDYKFFTVFESEKRKHKAERVMKNLCFQIERANEPLTFTLQLLHAISCHPELSQMLLKESVIPPFLNIHEDGMFASAMNTLLKYSLPQKLQFLIRAGCKPPQLNHILRDLSETRIRVALAEMNHVEWDAKPHSDEIVKLIFSSKLKIEDFVGSLSTDVIQKLHQSEAMKNIVCTRIRVCNVDAAKAVVSLQDQLKSLHWMEIDFDYNLEEVLNSKMSPINTPLLDLCFRDVSDEDVEAFCNFLYSISRTFSGLHVHRSTLSPQGITNILKYFFRRGMVLGGNQTNITKYRRYRFQELAAIEKTEELTDEKVQQFIGYDDRRHYNDNEVKSSFVTNSIDANALRMFFSAINVMKYFEYTCANYKIVKDNNENTTSTKIDF